VFLFNVDKTWSDNNIVEEMKAKCVITNSVRCVSHNEAQSKSFKVFIKDTDYDKVIYEDFWASRIKCRGCIRI